MYSYYNNGRFSFPPNFDFNIIPGKDSPTTIISVIGESDLFSVINKMEMFEDLTSSSMKPMNIIPPFRNDFSSEHISSYLTGFYCEKQKIVFIHLRSLNDSDILLNTHKTLNNEKLKENYFDIEDSIYLKLVLYLFLLSDFILINIIGFNFDPYYIELFSQVNILRKKFKSLTENELKTISNSLEVTNNGRLVQPRLLFIFNLPNSHLTNLLKQKPEQVTELRDRIEEKLFAVLKYHQICGGEYSLAKVQTNCSFVFVRLPLTSGSRTFSDLLTSFVEAGCDYSVLAQPDRHKQDRAFDHFLTEQIYTFSVTKESSGFGSENISCRNWFKACHKLYNLFCSDKLRFSEALWTHRYGFFKKGCELALSVAESHYKDGLPSQYSRDVHCDKARAARQILLSIAKGPTLLACVKKLEDNLNKVWAVGRQICEAISVTRQRCKHEVHLLPEEHSSSLSSWDGHPGPKSTMFVSLEDGKYSGMDGPKKECGTIDKRNNLPRMKHCSEVQLVSACNCGRRQGTRRDPFDYKEANYVFYEQMSELCCFRFARVALPENTHLVAIDTVAMTSVATVSSTGGTREGRSSARTVSSTVANDNNSDADYDEDDDEDGHRHLHRHRQLSDQSEHELLSSSSVADRLSLPETARRRHQASQSLSSGAEDDRDIDDDEAAVDTGDRERRHDVGPSGGGLGDSSDSDSGHSEEVRRSRNQDWCGDEGAPGGGHKAVFSGMFTTGERADMMPRYPSWHLLDSGPYFSYTHSSGLEYSGFVHGSNFLLPWDVPLKTRINKVRKQRVKRAFAAGNFVKAFLGFEMECPVGHRFFLAGPDNMMQGSMASHQVKEAVNGLLTRDIPLYFPCQCSTYLAQLMRIYVAVPNSNMLRLYLQPKVRPGPPGETPVFCPGSEAPIELEPGHLWVLRLPFAYEHDGHIYRQQADMRSIEECKLLKESIFYEEIFDVDD